MSVRFFEYAGVGIPLLLAAAVFYALVGPKLLPSKGGDERDCGRSHTPQFAHGGWKGWFTVAVLLVTVGVMIGADYFKCLPPMHITACVGCDCSCPVRGPDAEGGVRRL